MIAFSDSHRIIVVVETCATRQTAENNSPALALAPLAREKAPHDAFSVGSLVVPPGLHITNMAANNSTRTMPDRRRGAMMETPHEDGDLRADGLWRIGGALRRHRTPLARR